MRISRPNRLFFLGIGFSVLLLSILGVFIVGHCSESPATTLERKKTVDSMYSEYKENFPDVAEISPQDAVRLQQTGTAIFVDVRTPEEQQVSTIPGAIPSKIFLKNPEKYASKTIIAYCTIGYRSGKLAEEMLEKGITVKNLEGGLLGWVHAGGPLVHNNQPTTNIHVYGRTWNLAPVEYNATW